MPLKMNIQLDNKGMQYKGGEMKVLITSYSRFARASFWIRAPVGLLALTAVIQIKDLLDIVWANFHINQFIADIIVQTACAPVVVTLIAPMLSFLAPLFHGEQSGRVERVDDDDPFDAWKGIPASTLRRNNFDFRSLHNDDSWDLLGRPDSESDWYTDPSYSWFSGNIFHDDSH